MVFARLSVWMINDMIKFNGWFGYRFIRPQFSYFFSSYDPHALKLLTQKSGQKKIKQEKTNL